MPQEPGLTLILIGLEKEYRLNEDDINHYLNIIEKRVDAYQTGSIWITSSNRLLRKNMTRDIANVNLTSCMYKNQRKGKPVHKWQLVNPKHCIDIDVNISKLEKFMTTEVFVVNENDLVDLVAKIMKWKNIHHIPVVNDENKLTGIITSTNLNKMIVEKDNLLVVKDIMVKNIISVDSSTSIDDAKKIMLKNDIGCLPILEFGELVGILTKNDLKKLLTAKRKNE
jgi:CBS domain-containing protein